jgi:hypothetical protein
MVFSEKTGVCDSRNSPIRITEFGKSLKARERSKLTQEKFEQDNSRTRELQYLQTYALELQVGLWSGNKRKMEIAESHAQPLITVSDS